MKKIVFFWLAVVTSLLFSRCSVNRQIAEAKALGDCKFNIKSADSVFLAGYNIREFRSLDDFNPVKFPRIATGILRRNVPLDARVNVEIRNPTNRTAAINQLEYRILLASTELVNGLVNQRIEVAPGGGVTNVPIRLNANAYRLLTDPSTRDVFTQFVENLAGKSGTQPSKLTIQIKPTLTLGNKKIDYPGYISIDQEVTNKILTGE